MNPKEYIKQTSFYDHKDTLDFCKDRLTPENLKLIHYSMGMTNESSEVLDIIRKHLIYDKPLDKVHLKEELGDILWFIARTCDLLEVSFEELMANNILKLQKRYGIVWSKEKAINKG